MWYLEISSQDYLKKAFNFYGPLRFKFSKFPPYSDLEYNFLPHPSVSFSKPLGGKITDYGMVAHLVHNSLGILSVTNSPFKPSLHLSTFLSCWGHKKKLATFLFLIGTTPNQKQKCWQLFCFFPFTNARMLSERCLQV